MNDLVVIGAGISGLTVAVRALRAGWRVRVLHADPLGQSTSAVAAAIWYPYLAEPRERVMPWARFSLDVLLRQARAGSSGVRLVEGRAFGCTPADCELAQFEALELRAARASELPGSCERGTVFELPVADMPLYLAWLAQRVRELGGALEQTRLGSLDEAHARCATVINCSGLGARELAGDPTLMAVRGQVLLYEKRAEDLAMLDTSDSAQPIYLIPREEVLVVGGTAQPADEELEPRDADTRDIAARAERVLPALADRRRLGQAVGLRPVRPSVRVELEERPAGVVVHNYGHGGSGLTLAWGCAEEAISLLGQYRS